MLMAAVFPAFQVGGKFVHAKRPVVVQEQKSVCCATGCKNSATDGERPELELIADRALRLHSRRLLLEEGPVEVLEQLAPASLGTDGRIVIPLSPRPPSPRTGRASCGWTMRFRKTRNGWRSTIPIQWNAGWRCADDRSDIISLADHPTRALVRDLLARADEAWTTPHQPRRRSAVQSMPGWTRPIRGAMRHALHPVAHRRRRVGPEARAIVAGGIRVRGEAVIRAGYDPACRTRCCL